MNVRSGLIEPDADEAVQSTSERLSRAGRAQPVAWSLVVLGCVCGAVGAGLPWLLLSSLTAAILVAGHTGGPERARSVLGAFPLGVVLVSSVILVLMLSSGASGIDLLGTGAGSRPVLVGGSLLLGAALLPGRRAVVVARRDELVAGVPALGLLVAGVVLDLVSARGHLLWGVRGIDNTPHVLMGAGIEYAGGLSYSDASLVYPRMFHAVAAVIASSEGPHERDLATLLRMFTTVAQLEWFGWAVLLLVSGLLTQRLAREIGAGELWAGLAGAATGLTLMGSGFMGFVLSKGFATAVLLALLLATLGVEWLSQRRGSAGLLVSVALLGMGAAHTWQLALVPFGAVGLVAAGLWLRERSHARVVLVLLGVCVAGAGMGLAPVVVHLGAEAVGLPGNLPAYPRSFVGASYLAGGLLLLMGLVRGRTGERDADEGAGAGAGVGPAATGRTWLWSLAPVVVLGPSLGVSAHLVAAATGTQMSSYYPRKMLWYVAVLGVCCLWALLGGVLSRLVERSAASLLRVGGGVAVVGLMLVGLPQQLETTRDALSGAWSRELRVLEVLESPGIERVDVVWHGASAADEPRDRFLDRSVERLAQFWRIEGESTEVGAVFSWRFQTNAELCAALAAREQTVVLTAVEPETFFRDLGCAPELVSRVEIIKPVAIQDQQALPKVVVR